VSSTFSYNNTTVPRTYFCSCCKITNCRLYREYQALQDKLYCFNCGKNKNIDIIAAIPSESMPNQYYWMTSIPQKGIEWWHKLPDEDQVRLDINTKFSS
jgi:hypothetical protein